MNIWNNFDTLEHHKGQIWVSKSFRTENLGNICILINEDFHVLAYISPERLKTKDLATIVNEVVEANGTAYMLEDETTIMCSVCCKVFNEADVNIVDYVDDVCISCEKQYQTDSKI